MPPLPRLLSRPYRDARAAEAAGDLGRAAAGYARAGRAEDLARVRRLLGDASPEAQETHLRAALEAGDGRLPPDALEGLRRDLARALLARGRPPALAEAASLFEAAGDHLAAADALLALGRFDEARRALADGRHFERLEAVDRAEADRRARSARGREALEAAAAAFARGHRAEASRRLDALRFDPDADAADAEAARAEAAAIEGARPAGRVGLSASGSARTVAVVSELPCLLGRGEESPLPLTEAGISRHHARIVRSGHELVLEDLESRNGTFVEGLPVGPAGDGFVLEGEGAFDLGERSRIRWQRLGEDALLLELARGPAAGARAAVLTGRAPLGALVGAEIPATLAVRGGFFVLEAGAPLTLRGLPLPAPATIELLVGDRITLGDIDLEVRRT